MTLTASGERGGAVLRSGLAAAFSLTATATSLLLVGALGADLDSAEPIVEGSRAQVVLPPPPESLPPPDPAEAPPTEIPARPSAAVPPPKVQRPSATPPTPSGLTSLTGPGGLPLGPLGELPSIDRLPDSAFAEPTTEPAPTTPARVTHRPAPRYPALAQRRGIEGHVTVVMRIDERGRVVDAVIVDADPPGIFDETALRTVRQYRFDPARSGNRPVASRLEQTIRFELER
jgi:periplasmic protein TonB